ncbi:MAG: putative metal-dependent hydrolase [Bacteroidota bacterium]|nr:putative metal-dependent hydrolase [Bacteroidota bacterium]
MSLDPRFPIGKLSFKDEVTDADRVAWIDSIEAAPAALRAAVRDLSDEQLDTPYRERGWTVRQVVHHLFDSHCNAFIRFRLAITEDNPPVTAYNEALWAELPDTFEVPVDVSLDLVDGLHRRWVSMLRHGDSGTWKRTLQHPENGPMMMDMLLQMYAWHGEHHVAHITNLRARKDW